MPRPPPFWPGLRRARVVCSDETGVRVDGRGCWNWVFQNDEVVVHVVRRSRGAGVVAEVLAGHRPAIWVSDLHSAQRGHAAAWQVCLAHQLRDCRCAAGSRYISNGDAVFAPRMKALLLRAVVLARRHRGLAASTRREYRRRREHALDAVMALAPANRHGQRLRKRYGRLREHLFTFPDHPEVTAGRVGDWRGGARPGGVAVVRRLLPCAGASFPAARSVSSRRSSNRTCRFPASGFLPSRHTFALDRSTCRIRTPWKPSALATLVWASAEPSASPSGAARRSAAGGVWGGRPPHRTPPAALPAGEGLVQS
jgi:hypothetical protein